MERGSLPFGYPLESTFFQGSDKRSQAAAKRRTRLVESLENSLEVPRESSADGDFVVPARVAEGQTGRMEEDPSETEIFSEVPVHRLSPVVAVAREGVTDTGEVGPDLVRSSRVRESRSHDRDGADDRLRPTIGNRRIHVPFQDPQGRLTLVDHRCRPGQHSRCSSAYR